MRYNVWEDCPKVPITELLSFIVDNRGKTVPTSENGHILIATNCVTNKTLFPVYEKVRYLSDKTYQTWFRAHPLPGDILFVNKGTPGRVCMVPDPVDFCIAQDMIALRADDNKIYNKYLFAILRSKQIQMQIYNTTVGDVIPHFKKQFMGQILIPVPDRNIQEYIGDLYYSLCLKSDQNKKINDNLENQAQAIFKNWLIDFEPFQDGEFVDSGLGPIPKGWKIQPLTAIADYLNGLPMQKFRPTGEEHGIPVLKIKELRQGACDTSSEICSENIKPEYIVNNGDVIFSWSGSLMVDIWCGGLCGLNQHLFKVSSDNYDKWFYYFWTKHYISEFAAIAAGKATTMGHIKRSDLEKALTIVPDKETYDKATILFTPIIDQIIVRRVESHTINALRDTILSKLLNGEFEVQVEV